ncbi:MAG: hypothetical protein PHV99_01290 [Candidatus Pacebacteria bacterium]|nr:hypothetical protein [Candidatus Paceibacterota bacterium]
MDSQHKWTSGEEAVVVIFIIFIAMFCINDWGEMLFRLLHQ